MDIVLVLLILGCLVAMTVGLFKPGLVIKWGKKQTRPRVVMIYGGLFIALFIVLGMTEDVSGKASTNKPVVKIEEQQKVQPVKPEVVAVVNTEPDVKYDKAKARMILMDWIGEHDFSNVPLALNPGTVDGSMIEVGSIKYHMFTITGLPRAVDILVDPYSGAMFFYDTGLKPQPIDKWYLQYRASHRAPKVDNRIDENFEWVERPSVQNGAIVCKIKNISKDTYKTVTIEITLSDASKANIGTLASQGRNLKPGDVWGVTLPITQQNVASYDIVGVKGFTW